MTSFTDMYFVFLIITNWEERRNHISCNVHVLVEGVAACMTAAEWWRLPVPVWWPGPPSDWRPARRPCTGDREGGEVRWVGCWSHHGPEATGAALGAAPGSSPLGLTPRSLHHRPGWRPLLPPRGSLWAATLHENKRIFDLHQLN